MKRNSTRDTIVLCLIVVGSLALSGGLGAWLVRGLIAERGPNLQRPGMARGYFGATIWKGELWYIKHTQEKLGQVPQCHIHRRNLETGEDHRVPLALTDYPSALVATEDRLWMIGADVYETDGESLQRTGPALPHPQTGPSGSSSLLCNYFVQGGVLSSVRETDPERHRVVHLIEGQWLDGSEVILPGLHRRWENDEPRQRKVLAPRTSAMPLTSSPIFSMPTLTVIPDRGRMHLVAFEPFRNFLAYREGFEFAGTPDELCSALHPANASPEASGWEYVAEKSSVPFLGAAVLRGSPVIVANQAGPLNEFQPGPSRGWMRIGRNRFLSLGDVPDQMQQTSYPILVSSPNRDASYLLNQHQMQGAKVFAVEETGLRMLPHDLPGGEWPMIWWFVRLGMAIGAAWLTHLVVLVIGSVGFWCHQTGLSCPDMAQPRSLPCRAVP